MPSPSQMDFTHSINYKFHRQDGDSTGFNSSIPVEDGPMPMVTG